MGKGFLGSVNCCLKESEQPETFLCPLQDFVCFCSSFAYEDVHKIFRITWDRKDNCFTKIYANENFNFSEGVACVRAILKSSFVPNLKITQKQQIDRLIRFLFKYGRSLNF